MEEKMTEFYPLTERPNFSKEEEHVLQYWREINAFQTQLKKTEGQPPYTFYDGPPFATGLPHYGHICAGTIKDVVTRYATQTGHYVSRRFGWDCHGLPIEYEIDKEVGIKSKEDYEKIGIAEYNKKCRGIVMRFQAEWEKIVERSGRWIDFKNNYKTMDTSYMESVWWTFKQIYEKKLVYRGCRVMPFSTACNTVLSNFEAGSNYKEVWDPSIWLTFPLEKDPTVKLVAWTTTPWTLPSNLALAVNPTFVYLKYKDLKTGEVYIAAECRMSELYPAKQEEKGYEIIEKLKGTDLEGLSYIPLFDYFISRKQDGCFKVITADFVTSDTGTGIVHCAPAFGEEDYKICVKKGIIKPDNPPCPVDENGCFTNEVKGFEGVYVKTADKDIKKLLKSQGRLIHESQIKHSYPFCWRSDTPLIYRAQHSWFIKVTDIKGQMLENNKKSYWVPKFAQEKRFHNWLENAEDWCFSRSRIWGNPIPLWVSDDFEEIVCVGSIKELQELSGFKEPITDLHREFIDHITIPSKQGKGVLHRIPEIFDCWFESGSMPFAQNHYPFEMSEEDFSKQFPGDFIAEGIDQTRGWFYTLLVISTAVKESHTFKNLIVNGIVLAADGKKMSKRLKNYPDPKEIMDQYGADAMRLYLMNSCVVKGETINFKEEGVKDVVKDIFLPWFNANRFLLQNISRFEKKQNQKFWHDEKIVDQYDSLKNNMDKWIIAQCEELITLVRQEMGKYKLYKVVPKLVVFLEQLTNWHVRLNRRRLKGETDAADWKQGLTVLFDVILKSTILMACYVPFITELFYKNLVKCIPKDSKFFEESIHFLRIPEANLKTIDKDNQQKIETLFKCIDLGRALREKAKLSFKQPIASCTIINNSKEFLDGFQHLTHYIKDELNCKEIMTSDKIGEYIEYSALPDNKVLGKRLGKSFKDLAPKLRALTPQQISTYMKEKKLDIGGVEIIENELITSLKFKLQNKEEKENQLIDGEEGLCVILDGHQTEDMKKEGITREFTNRIQKLRKKAGLNQDDDVIIFASIENKEFLEMVTSNLDLVKSIIQKPIQFNVEQQVQFKSIIEEKNQVNNVDMNIKICWNNVQFYQNKFKETFDEKAEDLMKVIICYNKNDIQDACQKNSQKQNFCINQIDGVFTVTMNNEKYQVKQNEHFQLF